MPILTNITVTAYCACVICCGPKAQNLTAHGTRPVQGRTIAASRAIPFDSTITIKFSERDVRMRGRTWKTINGVGHNTQTFTVEDRLSTKYDQRIDIFFARHRDALAFGIHTNCTIRYTIPTNTTKKRK